MLHTGLVSNLEMYAEISLFCKLFFFGLAAKQFEDVSLYMLPLTNRFYGGGYNSVLFDLFRIINTRQSSPSVLSKHQTVQNQENILAK